jgi:phospholipase C
MRPVALLSLGLIGLIECGCRGLLASNSTPHQGNLQDVQHIIFMAQENRGFEHYFGALREYWAANGYPDQSFDGLPQFNPSSGKSPLRGPVPTNPGCDPAFPFVPNVSPPQDCIEDNNSPAVDSFHLLTMCVENPSPFWNESHVDFNMHRPVSGKATLDGFVWTAAHDARTTPPPLGPYLDTIGMRAMGYYDGGDFPYYYYLASNFGTSDRWFSPVMTRTQANRMYSIAATSAGHVYPPQPTSPPLSNQTIFDLLQAAGVSWKVYVTDLTYGVPPAQDSALNMFTAASKYSQNIVPVSQYLSDLQNGTLPAVAYIDPGYNSGLDEHPTVNDATPENVQTGAQYISSLINALMQSSSWNSSVFILTWDEFGGFYDHVPAQPTVSPDGTRPSDLQPRDICTYSTGPTCDFVYTGYRVPLLIVSPFSKKNYVSHTVADYTAWLKFVETRFKLSSLTHRDAAQMDLTEFFDFNNVPWQVPPTPPSQPTNGSCYIDHLP